MILKRKLNASKVFTQIILVAFIINRYSSLILLKGALRFHCAQWLAKGVCLSLFLFIFILFKTMPAIAQVLLNITIGKQFAERAAEGSRGQTGQQRTERAA